MSVFIIQRLVVPMAKAGRQTATCGGASVNLRRRLAAGLAESIAQRGYQRTTVRHIIASSGISRRAFYEHFGGKTEAFIGAHSEALACLTVRLSAAGAAETDWPRKVSAAIATALEEAARRPCQAQLLAGDPFAAGPRRGYCQELLVARFAPSLRAGRRASPTWRHPPILEEALLGSLLGIVSEHLRAGAARTLPSLSPTLTELVLSPYIGAEEAKRVIREQAFARLRAQIEASCTLQQEWPARVAAGVRAAFDFAADRPYDARLLTTEALRGGEQGQSSYQRLIAHFAALLLPGRDLDSVNADLPAIVESAAAGSVALLVGRRLNRGQEAELPALAPEAIQFVLTPYLGPVEAKHIATTGS